MGEKRIQHVVFDFDGTIADSIYLVIELINQVADKYKFEPIREKDYEYLRSLTIMERCRALHIPVHKIPGIGIELTRAYYQAIGSIKAFAGIDDMLRKLKAQNLNMSIISSNASNNISKFLSKNNLDYFDSICSSSNLFGKDKTIKNFIKKLHLKKDELIYIGDEHRDIVASKANKIKVISVSWGADSLEILSKANPDFIVEQPSQIVEIIEALNK